MGTAVTYGPENLEETRSTVRSAIQDIPEPDDDHYGTKEQYLLAVAGTTLCSEIKEGATLSQGELQATVDAIAEAYQDELGKRRSGMEAEDEFLQNIDAQLNGEGVRFYE